MPDNEKELNIFDNENALSFIVHYVTLLRVDIDAYFGDLRRNLDNPPYPVDLVGILRHGDAVILPKLAIIKMLIYNVQGREYGGQYLGDLLSAEPDETHDRWQVKEAEALRIIGWLKLYKTLMKKAGNSYYKRDRYAQHDEFTDRMSHLKWLFNTIASYFLTFSMDETRDLILYGQKPGETDWDIDGRDYP